MEDADKGDCENASFHSHATMNVMNVVWSILDGMAKIYGRANYAPSSTGLVTISGKYKLPSAESAIIRVRRIPRINY